MVDLSLNKVNQMEENKNIKIAVIDEQVQRMKEDVKKILENHLPHIQQELERLNEKVDNELSNVKDSITELRVSMARAIGMAVGAIGLLQIILKFVGQS